jgi:hypothetical protein
MGLLNRSYPTDEAFDPAREKTQWERFANYVQYLNKMAKTGECYKVLYLARHGEGYHNVEEAVVGTPMWDVCFHITSMSVQIIDRPSVTGRSWKETVQLSGTMPI